MLSSKLEYNVLSIALAVNICFTTITFTESEFGQHQYNVSSDSGINYSDELEGYDNREGPTDFLIDKNQYIILQINNHLSFKTDINDIIQD